MKTPHSIVCTASVNPEGSDCQLKLQYGLDTTYGNEIALPVVPSGWDDVQVVGTIDGLDGSTLYHWRFVATNAAGETNGDDVENTTLADVAGLPIISDEIGVVS